MSSGPDSPREVGSTGPRWVRRGVLTLTGIGLLALLATVAVARGWSVGVGLVGLLGLGALVLAWDRMSRLSRPGTALPSLPTAGAHLDATFQATPVPLFLLDPGGRVQRWNREAERVFGWTEEEIRGERLPFVPEELRDEHEAFRARVLAGERLGGQETERVTRDGLRIPIRAWGARVVAADGTVLGVVGLAEDLRESRDQSRRLRALNRALAFVSASNSALVRNPHLPDFLEEVGRVAIETGGYDHIWVGFAEGPGGESHLHQRSRSGVEVDLLSLDGLKEEVEAARVAGVAFGARALADGEVEWKERLAREGYASLAILPFPPESEAEEGFVGLAHRDPDALDDAEIRVLQELVADFAYGLHVSTLRRDLFLIREAVASLDVGLCVMDAREPGSPVIFVNRGFTEVTGFDPDEVVGGGLERLLGPETDPGRADEFREALAGARPTQMTLLNYRASGETFWNRLTVQPVRDDAGEVVYLASIHEDVTETRRLAQELEHQSRLSAVGELAGGVAHDFRNILTASQGLVELALDRIPAEHDAREYLSELRTVTVRGSRVTERLLALSRRGGSDPEVQLLRPLLREIASLVSHTLRDDVVFSVEAPGEVRIPVELDRDQFTHAVLNLVRNAEQAMAGGGTLTLEVHFPVEAGSPDWWPVDLAPSPDTWVRVTVRDTGPGMDAETLSRAFDPYFTTKAPGEGTGLGLPSVYGAVESMGGRIWLESEPGVGTAAHVLLPTLDPDRADVEAVGGGSEGERGHRRTEVGTILLAEDDETVLSVFRRALENGGHRVRAAPDGRTALELFEDDPAAVDLVVTDGVMPQVSGAELAARVWARRPGTPVLVTSGFGAEDLRARFPDEPGGPLLFRPKPLPLDELMDTVEELLAGARRAAGGPGSSNGEEGREP